MFVPGSPDGWCGREKKLLTIIHEDDIDIDIIHLPNYKIAARGRPYSAHAARGGGGVY